jgi:hypothetical protein
VISSCRSGLNPYEIVTPAKAGVREANPRQHWIPACAGMTSPSNLVWFFQQRPVGGTPARQPVFAFVATLTATATGNVYRGRPRPPPSADQSLVLPEQERDPLGLGGERGLPVGGSGRLVEPPVSRGQFRRHGQRLVEVGQRRGRIEGAGGKNGLRGGLDLPLSQRNLLKWAASGDQPAGCDIEHKAVIQALTRHANFIR